MQFGKCPIMNISQTYSRHTQLACTFETLKVDKVEPSYVANSINFFLKNPKKTTISYPLTYNLVHIDGSNHHQAVTSLTDLISRMGKKT